MKAMKRILLFTAVILSGSMALSQFANVFEIQATAMGEVNSQISELNAEKRPGAALALVVKVLGNLEKQSGAIPNYKTDSIFEIAFDDMISTKTKSKISPSEIFNFQLLSESSKQQVFLGLEQKYSSAFFDMALQMRRFQLHHAFALSLNIKNGSGASSGSIAAEAKAFDEIAKTIAHPFLLKNTTSGITYVFDLTDILSSSIDKTAISTEYASINSRLLDLYVDVANDSKNINLIALKNSKRPNVFTSKLFSDVQLRKVEAFKLVMATAGNKLYVQ